MLTNLLAFFDAMLKDFGVQGVRVQEVVSLDEEILAYLPSVAEFNLRRWFFLTCTCRRPVYGLIFLFRWREDDPDKQEQSCPEGVWFANQVC